MAPPPPRRPTPRRRAGGASLGAGRGARCRCRGGKRERPPGEGLEEREVWEAPDGAVFQAPDGKVFEALDPAAEGLAGVSEERFGPDVVLAVGLAEAELAGIRQMLEEIGAADILQLRAATKNSMARSLADNLTAPAAELAGPLAEGVPRAVILSGMSPAEVNGESQGETGRAGGLTRTVRGGRAPGLRRAHWGDLRLRHLRRRLRRGRAGEFGNASRRPRGRDLRGRRGRLGGGGRAGRPLNAPHGDGAIATPGGCQSDDAFGQRRRRGTGAHRCRPSWSGVRCQGREGAPGL